jgi:exoribonuclease R
VPSRPVRIVPTPAVLAPAFDGVRAELGVPTAFPADVESETAAVLSRGPTTPPGADPPEDRRDLDLVSIDPPGSRDLDQAFAAQRRPGGGYRVWYAIADVASFVAAGGALDREARSRGVTLYQPDRRTPLYPDALGQGAASLLPDADRPALLWEIDLDGEGTVTGDARLRRALVRNRRALAYPDVQAALDAGTAPEPMVLLREIGQARQAQETARGGIDLRVPTQEVVLREGRVELRFAAPSPVEGWNAQISLLAGATAAAIMLDGGVGLIRTLPAPEPAALDELRRRAEALGVAWPAGLGVRATQAGGAAGPGAYPALVRSLDPTTVAGAVLLRAAARVLRGAGYEAFDGAPPEHPVHAAVALPYAHVTAPLRRLADRYANEVVVALVAGRRPPAWAIDALGELPALMAAARRRERDLENATVDAAETLVLSSRVGESFAAIVIGADRNGRRTVQLRDPAVVGPLADSTAEPGDEITVVLRDADPATRTVTFAPAAASGPRRPA